MQKTTQVPDAEQDFEPTSDPLPGSGFDDEPSDPEFSDGSEDEEATEE